MAPRAPRSYEAFLPQHGERALIVGQTGGGKTGLATWLLLRLPTTPCVLYDTKIEPKFDKLPASKAVVTIDEMLEAYKDVTIDYIIVRPPEELLGEPKQLDEYLWQQYLQMHNTVAYLDEGATFHSESGKAFKGLLALMSRGRSKGITTIVSTQRPQRISRSLVSEMSKAYIFYLQDKRDKEVVDNVIPEFSKLPNPDKYQFYYWTQGMNTAILFQPIKLDRAFDTGYTDEAVGKADSADADTVSASDSEPHVSSTKHVWV